jgi:6-pyruvoyltetrahydropterin/6-carboxytetrahydropterin synthase
MYELSKQFWFEAAHTLKRAIEAESSKRIHGHSYRAVVTIAGEADDETGMVMDLGHFELALEKARNGLDHRMLDDVDGLGPATVENLCAWIWRAVSEDIPQLARVAVHRDSSGDVCTYFGPDRR